MVIELSSPLKRSC